MDVPLSSPEPVVSHAAPVHPHPVVSGGFSVGVTVPTGATGQVDATSGAPGHAPTDDAGTLDVFRTAVSSVNGGDGVASTVPANGGAGAVQAPNSSSPGSSVAAGASMGIGASGAMMVGTSNLVTASVVAPPPGHAHMVQHQHQVTAVVGGSPHGVVGTSPHSVVATAPPGVGVAVQQGPQLGPPMQVSGANGATLTPQHTNDVVHDYLQEVRRGAPHDGRRYHDACEVAFARKNGTLAQALDALELARLSNAQCKVMLSVMNVTGCKNSCLAAKKHILACKMVQRQVALQALFDITSRQNLVQAHEQRADGGTSDSEVARVKSLPKTSASADPVRPGQVLTEYVNWARGDVPMFVDGEVLVGQPELDGTVAVIPTLEALDGDTKPTFAAPQPLKRRGVPTTPGGSDQATRRRRLSNGDAAAANAHGAAQTDTDIYVKEAEAQSASARAVSDTLKAIKEAEMMMASQGTNDESRAFYKSVVDTLRDKISQVLGMPKSPR